jgi:hypothetical protein
MKPAFFRGVLAFTTAVLFVPGGGFAADVADTSHAADSIVFHYGGRVKLNFLDSSGIVYGYVTALSGVLSSSLLFRGRPGETTAYLTFRANIKFESLPGNGLISPGQYAVTPFLVQPGAWSIYFTANPAHNWDDPDTFSNGQIIAALQRPVEQFSIYPAFSINAGSANLQSSTPFTIGGRAINLREIAPRGLVNVTSGPLIPLSGSTTTSPIFALSGYSLVAAR